MAIFVEFVGELARIVVRIPITKLVSDAAVTLVLSVGVAIVSCDASACE